jgi:hypothetical protein
MLLRHKLIVSISSKWIERGRSEGNHETPRGFRTSRLSIVKRRGRRFAPSTKRIGSRIFR